MVGDEIEGGLVGDSEDVGAFEEVGEKVGVPVAIGADDVGC